MYEAVLARRGVEYLHNAIISSNEQFFFGTLQREDVASLLVTCMEPEVIAKVTAMTRELRKTCTNTRVLRMQYH